MSNVCEECGAECVTPRFTAIGIAIAEELRHYGDPAYLRPALPGA